jgi:CO/xanthine dehydrogenase Mo-binding subunit
VQWAREAHLDALAAAVGIDALTLRRRNLVADSDRFILGGPIGPVHLPDLLDAVAQPPTERGGKGVRRRGVGYGVAFKTTSTPTTSEAEVRLDSSGVVSVLTSTVDIGQGASTVLAQIAAAALTLPTERIVVTTPDTDHTPPDQGTVSSRSTFSMGRAVELAALAVLGQLVTIAERELEIGRADLVLADGNIRPIDGSSPGMALDALVRASRGDTVRARAAFTNEAMRDEATGEIGISTHHHQAAASALVEVDLETGAVDVIQVRVSTHAGLVINPTLAELQSEGNIAFAVGQGLMEEIVLDGGQIQNASLADYMIPSIQDYPDSSMVIFTEDANGEVHGIGETALPAVLPAVTNAVASALGTRLYRLPLTPERTLAAIAMRPAPGSPESAYRSRLWGSLPSRAGPSE